MSIAAYREKKKETIKCPQCDEGVLFQVLNPVRSKVERRKEDLIVEIEDETRKIVNKVLSGDERAIADVYGSEPNAQKSKKQTEKSELANDKRRGSFSRVS
jgi:hypothetical protein